MIKLLVVTAACALAMLLSAVESAHAKRTSYYFDVNGGDANAGTSPEKPYNSLESIRSLRFEPGDRIMFKRNQSWYGSIKVRATGNELSPVTIGAYGEGKNPIMCNTFLVSGTVDNNNDRYSIRLKGTLSRNKNRETNYPGESSITYRLPIKAGFKYCLRVIDNSGNRISSLRLSLDANIRWANNRNRNIEANKWTNLVNRKMNFIYLYGATGLAENAVVEFKTSSREITGFNFELVPLWSSDEKHVFKIDMSSLGKYTDMIKNGLRLSRVSRIEELNENNAYFANGIYEIFNNSDDLENSDTNLQIIRSAGSAAVISKSDQLIIENIDMVGGDGIVGDRGVLVIKDSTNITVRNCLVRNSSNTGVMLINSGEVSIRHCTIYDASLGGIYTSKANKVRIDNNEIFKCGNCIQDNSDLHAIGIGDNSNDNTVKYNYIHDNGYGGGDGYKGTSAVTIYNSSRNSVSNNFFANNWRGSISIDSGNNGRSNENVIQFNTIINNGLIGDRNYSPAISVLAHDTATSDNNLIKNNYISEHNPGMLWSVAVTRGSIGAFLEKRFKSEKCTGEIVEWAGRSLKVVAKGEIVPNSTLTNGEVKIGVARINAIPSVISFMSPLKQINDNEFSSNTVIDSSSEYIISISNNKNLMLGNNVYCSKNGLFRTYIEGRGFMPWENFRKIDKGSNFFSVWNIQGEISCEQISSQVLEDLKKSFVENDKLNVVYP